MKFIYTIILLIICSAGFSQNTWKRIASFGGGERERAISFVIGGRAYVGTGQDSANAMKKDFWEYDPASNSWSQKADFPGQARRDGIGFAIGNRGYAGTGVTNAISWLGVKKADFYEYNPVTNSWTTRASWEGNFGQGVYYASAFATSTKGYLVCGKLGPSYYSNELWEFDPDANDWIKKANFPGTVRYGGAAFAIGDRGYFGCGADENYFNNDFYTYDPQSNTWDEIASFPGSPRFNPVGLSINGRGFVGLGSDGGYQKDFYEYNPLTNSWMQKADFPASERRSCVAFTISGYGYVGTGNGVSGIKRSVFKYKPFFFFFQPEVGVERIGSTVGPNPVHNTAQCILRTDDAAYGEMRVFDMQGRQVWASVSENGHFTFDRKGLSGGMYMYLISAEGINQEAYFSSGKIYID